MKDTDRLDNRLKELRARLDFTQEELAQRVGVTRQTIIAIEGKRYNPSALLALRIAEVFGLPLEEVFWLKNKKERSNSQ
ncbi:MAG: helix-turn-helix domain-containing protein [Anaerolineae bacterium]|nr:helix-turn-helix domain-containing protein [Anaerolineae bacterium]NIN94753.1 helix-turn-helix domain-containing protein [Anaerolineae bacterium]NIQ77835.1 helix-turn-helix domain-containing protein [Anaerolineae bacterium]